MRTLTKNFTKDLLRGAIVGFSLCGLLSCKPSTGLAGQGKSSPKGHSPDVEKNQKEGRIVSEDDSLRDENQPAVPPEVISGSYLTCDALPTGATPTDLKIGCAAWDSKTRTPLGPARGITSVQWKLIAADGSTEIPLAAIADPRMIYDGILTIPRATLQNETGQTIKATVGNGELAGRSYATTTAQIADLFSSYALALPPTTALDDAGFQFTGSGRFALDLKTGQMSVTRSTKFAASRALTGVAGRILINRVISQTPTEHDFEWIQGRAEKENSGLTLPEAQRRPWREMRVKRTGPLTYWIIGYANCSSCGVRPWPTASNLQMFGLNSGTSGSNKQNNYKSASALPSASPSPSNSPTTNVIHPPQVSVAIEGATLIVEFATESNHVFAIGFDIPVGN